MYPRCDDPNATFYGCLLDDSGQPLTHNGEVQLCYEAKRRKKASKKQQPQFLKIPHQMKTLILTAIRKFLEKHLKRDLNKNHRMAASKKCLILWEV